MLVMAWTVNQAPRQLLEERKNVAALNLTTQDDVALRVNAVKLGNSYSLPLTFMTSASESGMIERHLLYSSEDGASIEHVWNREKLGP